MNTLDSASFDAALAAGGPLVVDFWARFAKVNTDEAPMLARCFGVRGIPTLVLFRDGREVKRASGLMDARSLARWVEAA